MGEFVWESCQYSSLSHFCCSKLILDGTFPPPQPSFFGFYRIYCNCFHLSPRILFTLLPSKFFFFCVLNLKKLFCFVFFFFFFLVSFSLILIFFFFFVFCLLHAEN